MSKRKTPILRFKGFNNAWEQRKLGDIAKRIVRKNKNLKSTLVLTISAQYGLVDQKKFFNKNIAGKNIAKYYLIEKGEFAYNKSYSKGHPLGVIKRLDYYDVGILSTLYIIFKPENINSNFLSAYYDTKCWYKEVTKYAAEGARNHGLLNIPTQDFFKTELIITTNNKEQQRIGNIIKIVNKILDLQKRKTALTKRIYLGILQKLFSNYSLKKYKRYKLKDVSISKKGKEIKKNEIFKTGKYAVVHYADLYKFYPVQKNAIHFSNKKLGILIPNNSLLFPGSDVTPSGLARTSTILQKNVFAGNDVIIFCLNENKVSAQFLSYELNFLKQEILSLITGTTIKHIYIKDLENMDIFLPSMKVQKLIENVLNKITYKRISNKNIIFQLSKFKQFLLQNMFI